MSKLLTLLLALVAPSVMAFTPLTHQRSFQVAVTQRDVSGTIYPPEESIASIVGEKTNALLQNFNEEKISESKADQETRTMNIESAMVPAAGALFLSILLMAGLTPAPEVTAPATYTDATFSTKLVEQQQMPMQEDIDQIVDQSAGFYFF
jgi:hypothetical protein